MFRPRWTIAGLIGAVAFAALAFAALHSRSVLWVQLAATMALSSLLLAALGAMAPTRSAFCRGYLVFGGAYLMLSLGPWCEWAVRPALLTTRALNELWIRLEHAPTSIEADTIATRPRPIRPLYMDPALSDAVQEWSSPGYQRFQMIGHAFAAIAHGIAGGLIAGLLARRRATP